MHVPHSFNYCARIFVHLEVKRRGHSQGPVSPATLRTTETWLGGEVSEGGRGSEIPLTIKLQTPEKERERERETVAGSELRGQRERRCVTGYEIKYSMSALFWSPPPPSTLTVPSGGRGSGGGGLKAEGERMQEAEG